MTFVMLLAGLVLLILGAELLVRGASRLAAAVGISPLVIGLTVVSFGTSAPELAISIGSTYSGQVDLAIGNVVGSNIFNILLILGVSAIITPLVVSQKLVIRDVPLMIAVSVVFYLLALDGSINRLEGLVLFGGIVAYIVFQVVQSRKEKNAQVLEEYHQENAVEEKPPSRFLLNVALVLAGLGLLVLGSNWLVGSAAAIARLIGVSELIIGLTIIAAGTSMPEVATSVMASLRGERDIAVGNVVGSNLFNILAVLGLSASVAPAALPVSRPAVAFDIPLMVAVAIACLPIFFTGYQVARWEGFLFLGYYAAYTAYLILDSSQHDALPMFSTAMELFVVPLTAITLIVVAWRSWRRKNLPPG